MKGHVYFGRMSSGAIKIGFTTDLERRLTELWHMVPGGVSLLASALGAFEAEAWVHKRFSHLKISGEWFRPEPELLDFINEVKKVGNCAFPDGLRADEIEVAEKREFDDYAKEKARFFIAKIAEPLSVTDKIKDIIDRAAKRTGLSSRLVRGMWNRERAISASEFLLMQEVYESRQVLSEPAKCGLETVASDRRLADGER